MHNADIEIRIAFSQEFQPEGYGLIVACTDRKEVASTTIRKQPLVHRPVNFRPIVYLPALRRLQMQPLAGRFRGGGR